MKIIIIYQTDLCGQIPGGIDGGIRGRCKWVPEDIEIKVVGLSTNIVDRPPGKWTLVKVGDKTVPFFPVDFVEDLSVKKGLPLSVRLFFGLFKYWKQIVDQADFLELHRIEHAFPYLFSKKALTLILHQNMADIRNKNSDIGWRHLPDLYFALEKMVFNRVKFVYWVRSDAVDTYKELYPKHSAKFDFLPTWMNTDNFYRRPESEIAILKQKMLSEFGWTQGNEVVLITVGRLDYQKNYLLLINAFAKVVKQKPNARLIIVGEGILRPELEACIADNDLGRSVVLAGRQLPEVFANWLNACDLFVLSSAYEGMPNVVLEAMACGLPVVSTRVGETPRIVNSSDCGELVSDFTPDAFAAAVLRTLDRLNKNMVQAALDSVTRFTPRNVLTRLYDAYRKAFAS